MWRWCENFPSVLSGEGLWGGRLLLSSVYSKTSHSQSSAAETEQAAVKSNTLHVTTDIRIPDPRKYCSLIGQQAPVKRWYGSVSRCCVTPDWKHIFMWSCIKRLKSLTHDNLQQTAQRDKFISKSILRSRLVISHQSSTKWEDNRSPVVQRKYIHLL